MSGWKVEHTTLEIVRGFITPEEVDAWEIVTPEGDTLGYVPDSGEANQKERAELFAAAPEMLEALTKLLASDGSRGVFDAGALLWAHELGEAALRKAGRLQ